MSDNLKLLEQTVESVLNENGAPGSILALDHKNFVKEILKKTGKYVGASFLANKVLTVLPSGSMSWESNPLNTTTNFVIKVSKLTVDLNDFGEVLKRLKVGGHIRFKDYVGRSVDLIFQSYTAAQDASLNDIYEITVKGVAENINYTYQDTEIEPCVFSVLDNVSNVVPDGSVTIYKGSGNTVVDGVLANVQVNDLVVGFLGGFFIKGFYRNTLADNDRTNIANYDIVEQYDI